MAKNFTKWMRNINMYTPKAQQNTSGINIKKIMS